MQILKIVTVLVALLPTLMLTNVSMAAQPDNLEPLEQVQPPPKVVDGEALDDPAIEPQITIRKKGADTIEEYRIGGEMYMMKVTPAHGVPYYLHKEDSSGNWINDGPNKPLSVPKWILFRF
ncbi:MULTISPECIES: DUF2782 domain-containing protein [Methylotenera]|uniref:DUF2782 domain-containing protein n=1 Tax=Methylotenera TaxID=359407 RepID=UPI0003A9F4E1